MPELSLSNVALTPIERPRCSRCQTRMMLARITLRPDGSEQRMFECAKCNGTEIITVADPLKSEAVARLAANVRGPG